MGPGKAPREVRELSVVGKPLPKVDAWSKVTGATRFVAAATSAWRGYQPKIRQLVGHFFGELLNQRPIGDLQERPCLWGSTSHRWRSRSRAGRRFS